MELRIPRSRGILLRLSLVICGFRGGTCYSPHPANNSSNRRPLPLPSPALRVRFGPNEQTVGSGTPGWARPRTPRTPLAHCSIPAQHPLPVAPPCDVKIYIAARCRRLRIYRHFWAKLKPARYRDRSESRLPTWNRNLLSALLWVPPTSLLPTPRARPAGGLQVPYRVASRPGGCACGAFLESCLRRVSEPPAVRLKFSG